VKQVSSQTVNPAPSKHVLDKENFHYVKVQNKDKGEWQTPIDDYLCGTDEIPAHELVSEDRRDTGSSRMSLLRIPIDVHNARMKRISEASKEGLREASNRDDGDSFESVQGGALSID
jgi:hypothetical protein